MKLKIFFIVAWGMVGCNGQIQEQSLLLGSWDSRDQSGLKLFFSENTLKEIYPDRTFEWNYNLIGDTLILSRSNAETQKHIIGILTDDRLELKPEVSHQVDIPFMDHVRFYKE